MLSHCFCLVKYYWLFGEKGFKLHKKLHSLVGVKVLLTVFVFLRCLLCLHVAKQRVTHRKRNKQLMVNGSLPSGSNPCQIRKKGKQAVVKSFVHSFYVFMYTPVTENIAFGGKYFFISKSLLTLNECVGTHTQHNNPEWKWMHRKPCSIWVGVCVSDKCVLLSLCVVLYI